MRGANVSSRELIRELEQIGMRRQRMKGDHAVLSDGIRTVVVPVVRLKPVVAQKIIKEYELAL